MEYEQFIDQLKTRLREAKNLFDAENYDMNHSFRRWRFQLTESIDQIRNKGYYVICNIESRAFGDINCTTKESQKDMYNMELQDTINEVERMIENYEKFGPPKKTNEISNRIFKTNKGRQKEVTIIWLINNVPARLWITALGILVGAFTIGVKSSEIEIVREIFRIKIISEERVVTGSDLSKKIKHLTLTPGLLFALPEFNMGVQLASKDNFNTNGNSVKIRVVYPKIADMTITQHTYIGSPDILLKEFWMIKGKPTYVSLGHLRAFELSIEGLLMDSDNLSVKQMTLKIIKK